MKRLVWFLLLLPSFLLAQEIKRPTTDVHDGSRVAGCSGTALTSAAMTNFYDASGTSTNSTQSATATASNETGSAKGRIFSGFSTSSTYSSLTLNINFSFSNTGASGIGEGRVSYSLNGGSTWVDWKQFIPTTAQATYSQTLSAGQDLSQLQVAICVSATGDTVNGGAATMTGYDIWTSGVVSAAAVKRKFQVVGVE